MWLTHEQGSLVVQQFIFFTYAHSLTIPTTNRVIFYLLVQKDVKSTKRWSIEMDISWLMKFFVSASTKRSSWEALSSLCQPRRKSFS